MKSKDKKRYEVIYITPNFCDGFWDNQETRYLDVNEVKDKIYENLENNEIEEILNRTEENIKEDNKKMSELSLALEGLGLLLLGIFNVLWLIARMIASAYVSVVITNHFGFTGIYWWSFVIVIFSLIISILHRNNNTYSELIDKYNEKATNEK